MKKNTEIKKSNASSEGSSPLANGKKTGIAGFFRFIGIVFSCIFEEIGVFFAGAVKKAREASLSFKVTVAATAVIGICAALVITLAMMVHGETDEIFTSDCVIGAKKHIVTAAQLDSYEGGSAASDAETDEKVSIFNKNI